MGLATERKRNLVRLFELTSPWIDALVLLAITVFFFLHLPPEVFSSGPATGGDMGSHYWTLDTLIKHGLPEGRLRVWSPGNKCGEPLLLHYFPLPFLWMAFLSIFIPSGAAFNLGTFFPVVALPFSAYVCMRGLAFRKSAPILSAVFSLLMLYNESFSIWGGNFLSTLSGQFAHAYALNFLFLAIGALAFELRQEKSPLLSAFCWAGVLTSHIYVALCVPFVALSFIIFYPAQTRRKRLFFTLFSMGMGGALAAWFIIPFAVNGPWTARASYPLVSFATIWIWVKESALKGFSRIMYPALIAGGLAIVALLVPKSRYRWSEIRPVLRFFIPPMLFYIVFAFISEKLRLPVGRAFPQLLLFFLMVVSCSFSQAARSVLGRAAQWLLLLPGALLLLVWIWSNGPNAANWAKWNYSGWASKPLYSEFLKVTTYLKDTGGLSSPRVMYEHNPSDGATGTPRAFEMLPYFAGRATIEGLYVESTPISPFLYFVQGLISKTPSCVLAEECPSHDLRRALPLLSVLGVGQLIFSSQEMIAEADKTPGLSKKYISRPWSVYEISPKPALVEIPRLSPVPVTLENWRSSFSKWGRTFTGKEPLEVAQIPASTHPLLIPVQQEGEHCEASLTLEFNRFRLATTCPGKFHWLKVGYHPGWRTSTGDSLWLTSPGFIGLIPSQGVVDFEFEGLPIWRVSSAISLFSVLILIFLWFKNRSGKRKEVP